MEHEGEKIIVKEKCPLCGTHWHVYMTEEEYNRWQFGQLIQYALPNHTPEERECLISGMCPDCQSKLFGEFDEEEG